MNDHHAGERCNIFFQKKRMCRVFPTGVSGPRYLSFAAPRPAYLDTEEKNINVLSALAVTALELKRLEAWKAGLVLASAVHENSSLSDVSRLRDMAFHQVNYYDIDVVFWLWTEDPLLKQRLRETFVAGGWQFAEEIRG